MTAIKFSILTVIMALALYGCSTTPYKPKVDTVKIVNMKFVPDTATVAKGDTIIWVNKDMVMHDITERSNAWSSGAVEADSTWKMAVTNDADYYCSIHVVMKGKIVLE